MMDYSNNKIISIYDEVCTNHKNYKNTPVNKRIVKLKELKKNILEHRNEIKNALYDDFGKNSSEVDLTEIFPVTFAAPGVRPNRLFMSIKKKTVIKNIVNFSYFGPMFDLIISSLTNNINGSKKD